ncbi:hypothetical protein J8J17_26630, partial [Mycobacterium tuberculosis]|nr:hypothetical protein [Mycobacterium tuberculosis]
VRAVPDHGGADGGEGGEAVDLGGRHLRADDDEVAEACGWGGEDRALGEGGTVGAPAEAGEDEGRGIRECGIVRGDGRR